MYEKSEILIYWTILAEFFFSRRHDFILFLQEIGPLSQTLTYEVLVGFATFPTQRRVWGCTKVGNNPDVWVGRLK